MPLPEDGGPYVRQLIEEAKGMKTKPLPGTWELMVGHPGVLAHGIDSQGEWDEDQRQAYVLSRLSEKYPEPYTNLPAPLARDVEAFRAGNRKDIQTPYHYRGWFTSGAPLHNVMQSLNAYPSLAYAGSAMLANAVDPKSPYDPDAKKVWDRSLNTITGTGAEALGLVPQGTRTFADSAADANTQRGSNAVRRSENKGRAAWNEKTWQEADANTDAMYTDGSEHFQRAGVPRVPALFLGAATDAVMDPFGEIAAAAQATRRGLPALRNLIKEFGFGQAAAGLAAAGGRPQP